MRIEKQAENYVLKQKIEYNKWTEGEKLEPLKEEQLLEEFGEKWFETVSSTLTSGMCDFYRLQPGKSAGGITMGEQSNSEYLSRCFADNYLNKLK